MHVHVQSSKGEAKFWMEPDIELARNHGLSQRDIRTIQIILRKRADEVRSAWKTHFGS